MSQDFQAGDFLIFQIESAYGLLRILVIEETENGTVWHLAAYNEMFLDIETADAALENSSSLTLSKSHIAVTNRAFEATQVARMKNEPLHEAELEHLAEWRKNEQGEVSDMSVRLLLGLR